MFGASFYKMEMLKERGVQAAGTVMKLYVSNGAKGRTDYNVTYAYPLVPKPAYTATDQLDAQNFNQLHIGDAVPIAYDRTYPPRSLLNFNDIVFERDNVHQAMIAFAIFPIALFSTLVAVLFFVRSYLKEKRLLQRGKAAVATIVSDTEYNAGKAGRKAAVTYTFTDKSGRVVKGERKGLPVKSRRKDAMYSAMFENPTVLYDPADSSKNMLYPFAFADCPPKPQPSIFSAP